MRWLMFPPFFSSQTVLLSVVFCLESSQPQRLSACPGFCQPCAFPPDGLPVSVIPVPGFPFIAPQADSPRSLPLINPFSFRQDPIQAFFPVLILYRRFPPWGSTSGLSLSGTTGIPAAGIVSGQPSSGARRAQAGWGAWEDEDADKAGLSPIKWARGDFDEVLRLQASA